MKKYVYLLTASFFFSLSVNAQTITQEDFQNAQSVQRLFSLCSTVEPGATSIRQQIENSAFIDISNASDFLVPEPENPDSVMMDYLSDEDGWFVQVVTPRALFSAGDFTSQKYQYYGDNSWDGAVKKVGYKEYTSSNFFGNGPPNIHHGYFPGDILFQTPMNVGDSLTSGCGVYSMQPETGDTLQEFAYISKIVKLLKDNVTLVTPYGTYNNLVVVEERAPSFWEFGFGNIKYLFFDRRNLFSPILFVQNNGSIEAFDLYTIEDFMQPVSVMETKNAEILAYPNPASHQITVDISESGTLSIYSTTGEVVRRENILPGKNQFDISNLAPGIYFFVTDRGKQTKLIVE